MTEGQRGTRWAEAWRDALREYAEPSRWRRGESYFRDGMVIRLFIVPGRIVGKVEGSGQRPYDVLISAPMLNVPMLRMIHFLLDDAEAMQEVLEHVPQLIPNPLDVEFLCSCPDWGDPCKHTVALWLAAAERFADMPGQLLRFRGIVNEGPAVSPAKPEAREETLTRARESKAETGERQPHSVDARAFWHGDPDTLELLLRETGQEGSGPPPWVFSPPVQWPERGISFGRLMERIYANLGDDTPTK